MMGSALGNFGNMFGGGSSTPEPAGGAGGYTEPVGSPWAPETEGMQTESAGYQFK